LISYSQALTDWQPQGQFNETSYISQHGFRSSDYGRIARERQSAIRRDIIGKRSIFGAGFEFSSTRELKRQDISCQDHSYCIWGGWP